MNEHVAPAVYFVEVHLMYASIVCLAAWILTSTCRINATWKYWIWVATSWNFVVPLGGFIDRFGTSRVSWATQLHGLDNIGIGISRSPTLAGMILGVWVIGALLMFARLLTRIRSSYSQPQLPLDPELNCLTGGVPVRLTADNDVPSVAGVLRPHICIPQTAPKLLSDLELDAVLIHEVTHAKRRDNLLGLLHEIALCALWFHPLLWLTRGRLALFRELSCDDAVIARSKGTHLVSALAKLAIPESSHVLRAGAASLLSQRVHRLMSSTSPAGSRPVDRLVLGVFIAIFLLCLIGTIAHYPSCFKLRV